MTTTYKVLGQVLSTAASSNVVDNLIRDTFDAWVSPNLTSASGLTNSTSSVRVGTTNNGTATAVNGPSPFIVSKSGATSSATWQVANHSKTNGFGPRSLRWYSNDLNSSAFLAIGRSNNSNTDSTYAEDRIPVNPLTTYYLGHSISWDNEVRSLNLNVYYYNEFQEFLSQTNLLNGNLGSTSSFARGTHSFTTPSNTRYIALQWTYGMTANFPICYIDGVSLSTNTTIWSTYNDPSLDSTTYPGNLTFVNPFSARILGFEGTTSLSRTVKTFAGPPVNLYTVPSGGQTVCSTLTISNPNSFATNYRVAVVPSGETLSMKHFIAFDHTISDNATTSMTFGITMKEGDSIFVSSDSSNVGFSVFGSESI
jgi:hypothetical protein